MIHLSVIHYVDHVTIVQDREVKFRNNWLDRQRASERRRMMLLEREKMRMREVAREQADEAVRLEREKERMRYLNMLHFLILKT